MPHRATRPAALAALLLSWAPLWGCVAPPTPEEVLAVGFRQPEQAFATFQVAARMDDPELELRCFSSGFRERNRVSQLTWREAREEFYARNPWLRSGIADAEIESITLTDEAVAVLRVRAGGRRLLARLVREDFAEAWAGGERAFDVEQPWGQAVRVQTGGDGSTRWIGAQTRLPAGVEADGLTELRFGREWKIDDVAPVDAASARD